MICCFLYLFIFFRSFNIELDYFSKLEHYRRKKDLKNNTFSNLKNKIKGVTKWSIRYFMTSSVKIIFTNTHNVQQQIISYKFHHLPKIQCRPFIGENIYFVEDTFL